VPRLRTLTANQQVQQRLLPPRPARTVCESKAKIADPDPAFLFNADRIQLLFFDADTDPAFLFDAHKDPAFLIDADKDPALLFDADPDPAFLFDGDPYSVFHFNADPDLAPLQSDGNLRPLTGFHIDLLGLHCEHPRPSTALLSL
jgi:hypothetical protein